MIHLATLPASKMTQNKVGKFPIFENLISLDLNCAKTSPNTPPNLLYISLINTCLNLLKIIV